jgi:hypothetical protein
MIAEVNATLTSLNLLTRMAKAAHDAHTEAEVREVVRGLDEALRNLHHQIVEIQLREQELIRAKVAAEQKLATYDKWETERARYLLKQVGSKIFVYELNPTNAAGEPIHQICPRCYEAREKSILQRQARDWDGQFCPICKNVYDY